jgi:hypothetical protein
VGVCSADAENARAAKEHSNSIGTANPEGTRSDGCIKTSLVPGSRNNPRTACGRILLEIKLSHGLGGDFRAGLNQPTSETR